MTGDNMVKCRIYPDSVLYEPFVSAEFYSDGHNRST